MNTSSNPMRPASIHFLFAGILFWITAQFYPSRQHHGGALIAVGIFGLLCFQQSALALRALCRDAYRRHLRQRALRAGTGHGQARWATLKEARKVGMLRKDGLFLGQLDGRDLYYPGETSVLTIAPPGAGKGVCLAVPNLLHARQSMIVTDPKGELFAMTAKHRHFVLGHRIIVLAPWSKTMSAELGIDFPDHRFNPLSIIRDGENAKDDAMLVASLLLPGQAKMDASSQFWNDNGQELLAAFILYLKFRYETIDLPLLRSVLLSPPEELFDTLCAMSECDLFGGALREYGGKLLGTLKNAPQQFSGYLGSAQKALSIYDNAGPLARHVCRGEIDFASLKDRPTTIYLIIPSERAATHASWLNLVVSLAIELVGRDRSKRRVTFLLDEFCNLGYLPNVLRGMALYRSQGVQCWLICQQINQLDRLYGIDGRREIMGMAEIVQMFGAWEPQTISLLSEWLGHSTLRQLSQGLTPAIGGSRFGFNVNASDHGAALMRSEDIRTMPDDEQLIFYRNLPPIRAKKVSYLTRRAWRRAADPNPYHR